MKKFLLIQFTLMSLFTINFCHAYPSQIKITIINNDADQPTIQIMPPQFYGPNFSINQGVLFNTNSIFDVPFGSSYDVIATINPNYTVQGQNPGTITINSGGSCIFTLDADTFVNQNIFMNIGNPTVQIDWTYHESCVAELASDNEDGSHFKFIIQNYEVKNKN